MSPELMAELIDTFRSLGEDVDTRVIVLTGTGDSFSAGGDLIRMQEAREAGPVATREYVNRFAQVILTVSQSVCPVIAAVNGYAVAGGCGMAAACDIVIAADDARFSLPEINAGIWAAVASVPVYRLIGPQRTAELLYLGRMIDAHEAMRIGLVNRVVPASNLQEHARSLAAEIAAKSPTALRQGREALKMLRDLEFETAIGYARDMAAVLLGSADAAEGLAAFAQKRKPAWTGR